MAETETPTAPAPPSETVTVRPKRTPAEKQQTDQKVKRQPPYAVILHNDDVNGMGFVISVLQKVFHYTLTHASLLMLQAHLTGRSIIWSGTLELAELKADQVRSCGPDPQMSHKQATPLHVTVEPLP